MLSNISYEVTYQGQRGQSRYYAHGLSDARLAAQQLAAKGATSVEVARIERTVLERS